MRSLGSNGTDFWVPPVAWDVSESDSEQIEGGERAPEEDLGPPVPSIPNPPEEEVLSSLPDSSEVDSGLRVLFWKLVFFYKFAFIGLTLGALLLVFDTGPDLGAEILAGAFVLLIYTLFRTKRGKERVESGEFADTEDGSDKNAAAGRARESATTGSDVRPAPGETDDESTAKVGGDQS